MEKIIISPGEVRGVGNIIEAGRTASDYQTYKSSVIGGNVEDIGGSNIRTYKMSWDGDHMIIDVSSPQHYRKDVTCSFIVDCSDAAGNDFEELPEISFKAQRVVDTIPLNPLIVMGGDVGGNRIPVYGDYEDGYISQNTHAGGSKYYGISWAPAYRGLYKIVITVEDSGIYVGDTIIFYVDVGPWPEVVSLSETVNSSTGVATINATLTDDYGHTIPSQSVVFNDSINNSEVSSTTNGSGVANYTFNTNYQQATATVNGSYTKLYWDQENEGECFSSTENFSGSINVNEPSDIELSVYYLGS